MVRSRILLFFALAAILLGQNVLMITTTSPLPYGTVGSADVAQPVGGYYKKKIFFGHAGLDEHTTMRTLSLSGDA